MIATLREGPLRITTAALESRANRAWIRGGTVFGIVIKLVISLTKETTMRFQLGMLWDGNLLIFNDRAEYTLTISGEISFPEDHWQICFRQSNNICCLGQESGIRTTRKKLGNTHQDFELIVYFTSTIDNNFISILLLAHGRDY